MFKFVSDHFFTPEKKNMKSEGYNKINIFVLQVVALSLLAVAKAGNLGLAYSSPVLAAAPIAHVAAAPIAHVAAAPNCPCRCSRGC
jgi:hypothetical protein